MLQNELLDQLFYLAERKYRVFPCWSFANGGCTCSNAQCNNIAKHPATRHGCKDATTDEAQIRRWVTEYPTAVTTPCLRLSMPSASTAIRNLGRCKNSSEKA